MSNTRPDRQGAHRTNYERNRKRIFDVGQLTMAEQQTEVI